MGSEHRNGGAAVERGTESRGSSSFDTPGSVSREIWDSMKDTSFMKNMDSSMKPNGDNKTLSGGVDQKNDSMKAGAEDKSKFPDAKVGDDTIVFTPPGQKDLFGFNGDKSKELPKNDGGSGDKPGMLDKVTDPKILKQVPDALYIGQEGLVTDTKNRNGKIEPYWLSGDAARSIDKINKELAPLGKSVVASDKNGAGRTIDTQTEIFQRSNGGSSFAAGAPTASNHTRGNAMDISNWKDKDVQKLLKENGWRQGDSKGPIGGDLHHWSFTGTPKKR